MIYTYSELKNNGLDNYNINKKVASQILVCLIFFAIISVGRDNLHNFPEYRYNREIKKIILNYIEQIKITQFGLLVMEQKLR